LSFASLENIFLVLKQSINLINLADFKSQSLIGALLPLEECFNLTQDGSSRIMDFQSKKSFARQPQNNRPLILIVDDNYDNLLFASCIVDSLGMRYVLTNDSQECLQLLEGLSPDLILLDIVMPRINGLEITRTLKQNEQLADIPIIAITGLTKTDDIQQIIEVGFSDYLIKPYLIEELEAKIWQFLNPQPDI
jgi:CheY-like chemotaxis protein